MSTKGGGLVGQADRQACLAFRLGSLLAAHPTAKRRADARIDEARRRQQYLRVSGGMLRETGR